MDLRTVADVPDFRAWDPGDWEAFGTNLTVVVAIVAALFAYRQVKEAQRTRQEQAQPFVVVDIQPKESVSWRILNLVIENVETTLARDVKIRFTPQIGTSQSGYDLANSALLREGIPTLPPHRRIEVLFDVSFERVKTELPMRYEAEVIFKDSRGRQQDPLNYVIDLGYLCGLQRVEEYGVHHTAKALSEIEKTLKRWTGREDRLNVWTRSEEQRERTERAEYDLTGNRPTLDTDPPPEIALALARNVIVGTFVRTARKLLAGLRHHR